MATIEDVFAAIRRERRYQATWGPIKHDHDVAGWLVILAGEIDEAMRAWRDGGDFEALLAVLTVASLATACLEQHGLVERQDVEIQRRLGGQPPPRVWEIDDMAAAPDECGSDGQERRPPMGRAEPLPDCAVCGAPLLHAALCRRCNRTAG
jgi:hypothetical protein